MGKSEEKRTHERPRYRWKDNFKRDLTEIGWEDVDWIDLAQDTDKWWAVVSTVMKLQLPQNIESLLTS
jgi:hypothetical protein